MNGYQNADDYYSECSAINVVPYIKLPTLLLSAEDDPFFTPSCFPGKEAEASTNFFLNKTRYGGHYGYIDSPADIGYWHEREILNFFKKY